MLNPEIKYSDAPKGKIVKSPVIIDQLEDEVHPIHNIKSNFQFASGNKFDSNSNKIILVKNIKRKGDMNEGILEAMSSRSRIGFSPRPKEIILDNTPQIYEEEKVRYN